MLARKGVPSSSCFTPQSSLASCILNAWLSAKGSPLNQLLSIPSPGLLSPSLPSAFCLLSSKQATPAQCGREGMVWPHALKTVKLYRLENVAEDTHVLGGVPRKDFTGSSQDGVSRVPVGQGTPCCLHIFSLTSSSASWLRLGGELTSLHNNCSHQRTWSKMQIAL